MPIRPCPKPFNFKYPEDAEKRGGIVREEELVELHEGEKRDYYKVAQLLEWKDGRWSFRLGYYKKPHGTEDKEWRWGAQTTFVINIDSKDNLIKALASLKKTHERMQTKR
jgi:hypothetical protein